MRFMSKHTGSQKNHRGDTIIEVLISMAILALVLGVAYTTSSRSLRTGTDAGIRSQALSQAQQQIEILKTISTTKPTELPNYKIAEPFCINPANRAVIVVADGESCSLPIGATPENQLPYSVVTKYDDATKTFKVTATWPSSRAGGEPNSTTLYYKTQNSFTNTPGSTVCDDCTEDAPTSPEEPFVRLTSNRLTVFENESVNIIWTTARTTNCTAPAPEPSSSGNAAGWEGPKNKDGGTVTVGPIRVDTTLRITCMRGAIGPTPDAITIRVQKINGFSASPTTVNYNSFTDITWNSSNTNSCTGSGGTGGWAGAGKLSSSTQRINNMTTIGNITFNLSCTGDRGTQSATPVVVRVNSPPGPVVDVWTSPSSISHGGSSNIYWRVVNGGISGTNCNAYGSWSGARTPGNGEQLGPANTGGLGGPNTYSYGISCTGPGGSHSDSANVSVAGPPDPPFCSSSAGGWRVWDGNWVQFSGGGGGCSFWRNSVVGDNGGGVWGPTWSPGVFCHTQSGYVHGWGWLSSANWCG